MIDGRQPLQATEQRITEPVVVHVKVAEERTARPARGRVFCQQSEEREIVWNPYRILP